MTSKPFADDVPQQDNALGVLHPIDPTEAAAACRVVAGRAVDADDLARLLDVLGIAPPEPPEPEPAPEPSEPDAHGTRRGYQRHLREGSDPCNPCREANRAKSSKRAAIPASDRRPLEPIKHGTTAGYRQHRYRGDLPACDPCTAATSEYSRTKAAEYRARKAGGGAA